MNSNAKLASIREHVADAERYVGDAAADELYYAVGAFKELDTWLSSGGLLPEVWRSRQGTITMDDRRQERDATIVWLRRVANELREWADKRPAESMPAADARSQASAYDRAADAFACGEHIPNDTAAGRT